MTFTMSSKQPVVLHVKNTLREVTGLLTWTQYVQGGICHISHSGQSTEHHSHTKSKDIKHGSKQQTNIKISIDLGIREGSAISGMGKIPRPPNKYSPDNV